MESNLARVHFSNNCYAAVFYDNMLDAVAAAFRIRHIIGVGALVVHVELNVT